jgi:hypothetical protein
MDPETSAKPPAPTPRMALLSATNETISFTLSNQSAILFRLIKMKKKDCPLLKQAKRRNRECGVISL